MTQFLKGRLVEAAEDVDSVLLRDRLSGGGDELIEEGRFEVVVKSHRFAGTTADGKVEALIVLKDPQGDVVVDARYSAVIKDGIIASAKVEKVSFDADGFKDWLLKEVAASLDKAI